MSSCRFRWSLGSWMITNRCVPRVREGARARGSFLAGADRERRSIRGWCEYFGFPGGYQGGAVYSLRRNHQFRLTSDVGADRYRPDREGFRWRVVERAGHVKSTQLFISAEPQYALAA